MSGDKDRAWEEVQKKAFTHWVNTILDRRAMKIDDLQKQFADGITIVHFVELLCEKKIKKKYTPKPKQKIHQIENTHLSLLFLKENGVEPKYLTASSEDFVDGNLKLILGFLWMLFRKFRIAKQMGVDDVDKATEGLLKWCKETTNGYKGVEVRDFRNSFNDGNAFLALVHAYDKSVFNYDEILEENSTQEIIEKAFEYGEKTMGIPQLLDTKDLLDGTIDERSVILYVSLYFHAFVSAEEKNKIEREKRAASAKATDLENEIDILNKKVQNKEEEYSSLKAKYEELEKNMSSLQSEKEKLENDIEELRKQFKKLNEKVEERNQLQLNGLSVLRKNLLEHLGDMGIWKDYLEQQREYESETVQLRTEQEVSGRQFEDQLEYLSQALGSENKRLQALLKQREIEERAASEERKSKKKESKKEDGGSEETKKKKDVKKKK